MMWLIESNREAVSLNEVMWSCGCDLGSWRRLRSGGCPRLGCRRGSWARPTATVQPQDT